MHLRRALLLFAIVLGLAALASAISRPQNTDDESPPAATEAVGPPTLAPGAGEGEPVEVAFDAGKPRSRALAADRAATLTVAVEAAGTVEIPRLGLSASAEPLTPARFDVLASEPRTLRCASSPSPAMRAGRRVTLVVQPPPGEA